MTNSEYETRIAALESQVRLLLGAAAYTYIAFLSIDRSARSTDPDFDKATHEIKQRLDTIWKNLGLES